MWFVMQTKAGQEEAVKRRAERTLPQGSYQDCKVLYCIYKKRYQGAWHEERERLLPGYLFVVTDDPQSLEAAAERMTGVTKLLGYGKTFCPVRTEEEMLLAKLAGDKDEIGMSYGVIENGRLKIRDGVLAGMEEAVRKIDRHKRRGYISLSLPGEEEKLVGIGLEITEKS